MKRIPHRPFSARRAAAPSSLHMLFVAIGLSLVLLLGGGYWLYATGGLASPPQIDKETLCLRGRRIDHASYWLVDTTDPLSQTDSDRLVETSLKSADALPEHALLVVAVLNPEDPAAPRIIFRRCAPRSPAQTSELTAGRQVIVAEWKKKFEAPLVEALRTAISNTPKAARSPIIATITALTRRVDFDATVKERELTVVTDLLEHDPKGGFSHMQGGDLMAQFRRSSLAQTWPDLKGVPVTVQYVQRTDANYIRAQTPAHRNFWRWWFTTAGAARVEFRGVVEPPPLPLPPITGGKHERRISVPRKVTRGTCNCGGS